MNRITIDPYTIACSHSKQLNRKTMFYAHYFAAHRRFVCSKQDVINWKMPSPNVSCPHHSTIVYHMSINRQPNSVCAANFLNCTQIVLEKSHVGRVMKGQVHC